MKQFVLMLAVIGAVQVSAAAPRSCRFDDIVEHIHRMEVHPSDAEFDLTTYGYGVHTRTNRPNRERIVDCAGPLLFPRGHIQYPGQSRAAWQHRFDYAWSQGYDNDSFVSDGMMMLGGCETGACYSNRVEVFIGRDGTAVAAMSTIDVFDLLPGETRSPGEHPTMYRSILGIRRGYDTPEVRRFIAKALNFENGPSGFFELKQGDQHRLSITEIKQD